MHPRNKDYWERMVTYLAGSGSTRQIAIGLVLYMRWLSALKKTVRLGELRQSLSTLLTQTAGLKTVLVADG